MEGELSAVLQLQVAQGVRRRPLGAVLLADGTITAQQLEEALLAVERGSGRLGEVLVQSGALTAGQLACALADQAGLEYVDLLRIDPDPTAAYLLPEHFARRYQALPLKFDGDDTIVVAVADPTDLVASDDLR